MSSTSSLPGEPTQVYVDGAYMRPTVQPDWLAALSAVCKQCRGLCCQYFELPGIAVIDGVVAWPEQPAAHDTKEDLAFVRAHFKHMSGTLHKLGCSALDPQTHLCTQYGCRPRLCRKYVCRSAWFRGRPPTLAYGTLAVQATLDSPLYGHVPNQALVPEWVATVGHALALSGCQDPGFLETRAEVMEKKGEPWSQLKKRWQRAERVAANIQRALVPDTTAAAKS